MFSVLGSFKCKVLSVLDLRDAFHSLRLSEHSKEYCRILPYFGRTSYLYQRMPMGLNIFLSIWQSYINAILDCLQCKVKGTVKQLWMIFCCSFHQKAHTLWIRRSVESNSLKISPRKCQLFRANLQYMGNEIFIKDKRSLH